MQDYAASLRSMGRGANQRANATWQTIRGINEMANERGWSPEQYRQAVMDAFPRQGTPERRLAEQFSTVYGEVRAAYDANNPNQPPPRTQPEPQVRPQAEQTPVQPEAAQPQPEAPQARPQPDQAAPRQPQAEPTTINVRQAIDSAQGDTTRAFATITEALVRHQAAGGQIVEWFDGKPQPLTVDGNGQLRDQKGAPVGMMPFAMGRQGTRTEIELVPPRQQQASQQRPPQEQPQPQQAAPIVRQPQQPQAAPEPPRPAPQQPQGPPPQQYPTPMIPKSVSGSSQPTPEQAARNEAFFRATRPTETEAVVANAVGARQTLRDIVNAPREEAVAPSRGVARKVPSLDAVMAQTEANKAPILKGLDLPPNANIDAIRVDRLTAVRELRMGGMSEQGAQAAVTSMMGKGFRATNRKVLAVAEKFLANARNSMLESAMADTPAARTQPDEQPVSPRQAVSEAAAAELADIFPGLAPSLAAPIVAKPKRVKKSRKQVLAELADKATQNEALQEIGMDFADFHDSLMRLMAGTDGNPMSRGEARVVLEKMGRQEPDLEAAFKAGGLTPQEIHVINNRLARNEARKRRTHDDIKSDPIINVTTRERVRQIEQEGLARLGDLGKSIDVAVRQQERLESLEKRQENARTTDMGQLRLTPEEASGRKGAKDADINELVNDKFLKALDQAVQDGATEADLAALHDRFRRMAEDPAELKREIAWERKEKRLRRNGASEAYIQKQREEFESEGQTQQKGQVAGQGQELGGAVLRQSSGENPQGSRPRPRPPQSPAPEGQGTIAAPEQPAPSRGPVATAPEPAPQRVASGDATVNRYLADARFNAFGDPEQKVDRPKTRPGQLGEETAQQWSQYRDYAESLVVAHGDAVKDGAAKQAQEIARELRRIGVESVGAVGKTIPFDNTVHTVDVPLENGQPVRVISEGFRVDTRRQESRVVDSNGGRATSEEGGLYLLKRAEVEAVKTPQRKTGRVQPAQDSGPVPAKEFWKGSSFVGGTLMVNGKTIDYEAVPLANKTRTEVTLNDGRVLTGDTDPVSIIRAAEGAPPPPPPQPPIGRRGRPKRSGQITLPVAEIKAAAVAAKDLVVRVGDSFMSKIVDDINILKKIVEKGRRSGRRWMEGSDPETMYSRLMHADSHMAADWEQGGVYTFANGVRTPLGPSLPDIIAPLSEAARAVHNGPAASVFANPGEVSNAEVLAMARHVASEEAAGRNPLTPAESALLKKALASATPQMRAEVDAFHRQLTSGYNATIESLVAVGFLNRQNADKLISKRPDYIDMSRDRVSSVKGGFLTGRTTSDALLVAPLVSYRKRLQMVSALVNEQIRKTAVAQFLAMPGMEEFGVISSTPQGPPPGAARATETLKAMGLADAEVAAFLEKMGGYAVSYFEQRPWSDRGENIMTVMANGNPVQFRIENKQLWEVIQHIQGNGDFVKEVFNLAARMQLPYWFNGKNWKWVTAADVTHGIKSGAVNYNPSYQASNVLSPFRDPLTFFFNTMDAWSTLRLPEALAASIQYEYQVLNGKIPSNKLFELFMRERGGDLRMAPVKENPSDVYRQLRPKVEYVNTAFDFMKKAGKFLSAGEQGPRFVEFINQGKKLGYTETQLQRMAEQGKEIPWYHLQSMMEAANQVTGPWNRQGSWTRAGNKTTAFLGPGVVSTAMWARAIKRNPKRALLTIGLLTIANVLRHLAMDDKEGEKIRYDELSPTDRYLNVPVRNSDGSFTVWRGVRGPDAAIGTMAIAAVDAARGRDPRLGDALRTAIGEATPPLPLPNAIALPLQLGFNRNAFNQPIVPRRDEGKTAEYNNMTHRVPFVINQLTGGRGQIAQPFFNDRLTPGQAAMRGLGVSGPRVVENPAQSVYDLRDRIAAMSAERQTARARGQTYPNEAEYNRLVRENEKVNDKSLQMRGATVGTNGRVTIGTPPSPERVTELNAERVRIAREALNPPQRR
jgi:hypothetical protein